MTSFKRYLTLFLFALLSAFTMHIWGQASVGTILWAEDFSGYSKDAIPTGSITNSHTGTTVYSGTLTYSVTNGSGTTKIYTENLAGGSSPELLVGKSSGTFSITGIPNGGATAITVSYKQNAQSLTVSVTGTGYSGSRTATTSGSFDITVGSGAGSTFTLTFTAGSKNVRLDDINVSVKTAGSGGGSPTLSSIAVKTAPTKVSYTEGEYFDPTGLVITRTYSDASTSDWTYSGHTSDFTFTPSTSTALTTSNTSVTITYGGKSTSQAITVTSGGGGGGGCSYDLSTNSYASASTSAVSWTSSATAEMVINKSSSGTNANNYIPTAQSSTRFYTNSVLTITPKSGVSISSIIFTATTSGYATALANSTWSNATASASGTTVTVTPSDGLTVVSATIGGTCGFTCVEFVEGASYTITAISNNVSYGTVSLTGSIITASPNSGYQIADPAYTVTSGTATVTRGTGENINKFSVAPSSDCTVRINFEPRPTATINLWAAGSNYSTPTGYYVGDSYSLPTTVGIACGVKTFVGWSTVEINPASATKPTSNYHEPGGAVTLAASQTFYAVYADESGGGTTTLLSEGFEEITTGNNTTTSGSSSAWSGNTNIEYVSAVYQAGGAVRLGGGSATGSIETKALTVAGGKTITVSFDVKGWSSVEGDIQVTVTGCTPETITYTETMSGSFETKSANFTLTSANPTVTIATTAKRAFIDNLLITTGGTTYENYGTSCAPCVAVKVADGQTTYGSATLNGGTASVDIENTSQVFNFVATPNTGYRFVNWTKTGDIAMASTTNATTTGTNASTTSVVTANFAPNSYTIHFDGNGADGGSMSDMTSVSCLDPVTLTTNAFTRTDYRFKGWATTPSGGVTYTDGKTVDPLSTTHGTTINLYAVWEEIVYYTITWNNGTSTTTSKVVAGEKVVLPSPNPTSCSTKYTNFIGWYTNPAGVHYAAGSVDAPSATPSGTKITALTKPSGDATYYAVYSDGTGSGTETMMVEFDFTDETAWSPELPKGSSNKISTASETSFEQGGYTIKLAGDDINGYYVTTANQLLIGKADAYIKLPAFSFATTKIVLTAPSGSVAGDVSYNVYVGSTAVSSAATGCSSGATFTINSGYRAAGNIYVIKIANAKNLQFKKLQVYSTGTASTGYISSCSIPTTWTITYDPNGKELSPGSSAPSASTAEAGESFTIPSNNYFSSPSFAQIGWNTNPAATAGLTTLPAHDAGESVTLYAIWQKSQIEITEVTNTNDIIIDHNFGGSTTATLDELVTQVDGSTANDVFISKYFESSSNLKLIAIFNGTKNDVDLKDVRVHIPYIKTATDKHRYIELDTLLTNHRGTTVLPRGEEIIMFSWQPTSTASFTPTGASEKIYCSRDQDIMDAVKENVDISNWIEIPYKYVEDVDEGQHALCFSGPEPVILERDSSAWSKTGWYAIDIVGAAKKSGSDYIAIYGDTNMKTGGRWGDNTSSWYCAAGKSLQDTTETIGLSTNRCLLVRKFSVVDGMTAVQNNIGTSATFSTLCSEWYGLHVADLADHSDEGKTNCETHWGNDNENAAASFTYVGDYDYNSQYEKYEEMPETKFNATYDPETGFTTIHINPCVGAPGDDCVEGGLAGLACDFLKITVKNSAGTQVLDKLEYKVPIIVDGSVSTNADIFKNEGVACAECDVVVLGTGTLTKAANGSAGDQPKVRNLMVYPNGTLVVPSGTTYNADSIVFRVQGENAPKAKLVGTLHSANEKITVTRRLTNARPYFFSLPYDCNINDITWSNGEKPTINTDFRVMTYNGQQRADNGSANNGRWWTFLNAGDVIHAGVGYNIQSAYKHMKELVFPMVIPSTDLTDAEEDKSTTVAVSKHENGSTTINNHNWNLIAQPFICQLTPNEGDKVRAGWLDYHYEGTDVVWERKETGNVYLTMPTLNASKITYIQSLYSTVGNLDPFVAFFVQAAGNGDYSFAKGNRILSAPKRHLASKAENEDESIFVGVTLSRGDNKDQANVRIRPDFTNDYQLGFDLEKFITYYTERPQIYMKTPDYRMAFQAVSDSIAKNTWLPVGVYGEQAGTYTFALSEDYTLDEVEAVYLHDNETGATINLLYDTYSFNTTGRVNTESRFSLNVVVHRRSPQIATDIPITDAPEGVIRKLLIDGNIYIQRGNRIYDITGKQAVLR